MPILDSPFAHLFILSFISPFSYPIIPQIAVENLLCARHRATRLNGTGTVLLPCDLYFTWEKGTRNYFLEVLFHGRC